MTGPNAVHNNDGWFASILTRTCTLEDAIRDGEKLLRRAAEDAMRMVAVGLRLPEPKLAA
jgi:glycerate 2-kinase